MNIARILYPVEVLGPGKRLAIWTAGCPHHCRGCSNPELWSGSQKYEISIEQLERAIREIVLTSQNPVDGITVTGGDPFYQAEELPELLTMLRKISDDILVYTGYRYEELKQQNNPGTEKSLSLIDVLIDGPYIESMNDGSPMRGSGNQKIIFLNPDAENRYCDYLKQSNRIQNFVAADGIISVGIHDRDFADKMAELEKHR